ncbi:hypothetical protein D3C72_2281530 [compost metagenome]
MKIGLESSMYTMAFDEVSAYSTIACWITVVLSFRSMPSTACALKWRPAQDPTDLPIPVKVMGFSASPTA